MALGGGALLRRLRIRRFQRYVPIAQQIHTNPIDPTIIPANPPGLTAGVVFALAKGGVVLCTGAAEVVVAAIAEVEVEVGACVLVESGVDVDPPGRPLAVRLTYAAQSGLGSARGQVSAWHKEYS